MIAPPEKTPSPRRRFASSYVRDTAGLWSDIPAFTAFAHEIEQAMIGPDLPYPQRLKLLERANHFGIRKFDANLIIAMVQNRAGSCSNSTESKRTFGTIPLLLTFAGLQSLILLFIWLIFA